MHSLKPVTALGGIEPRTDVFHHLSIIENDGLALASFAARRGFELECQTVLKGLLGVVPSVGKAIFNDPISGFWLGPDQWMLTAPRDSHELLADIVKNECGAAASMSEQMGAWICFDVIGDALLAFCERICSAPIRQMQGGDTRRTSIHHLNCILIQQSAGDQIRIFGPRASADSLHHALFTTATALA